MIWSSTSCQRTSKKLKLTQFLPCITRKRSAGSFAKVLPFFLDVLFAALCYKFGDKFHFWAGSILLSNKRRNLKEEKRFPLRSYFVFITLLALFKLGMRSNPCITQDLACVKRIVMPPALDVRLRRASTHLRLKCYPFLSWHSSLELDLSEPQVSLGGCPRIGIVARKVEDDPKFSRI